MSDGLPLRPTSHVRGGTDAEPNADAGRDPSNPLPLPAPAGLALPCLAWARNIG